MNSLPSIAQNNLPVGHRVKIGEQEYQVAMTKGRRPRRYWKKIASAGRPGRSLSTLTSSENWYPPPRTSSEALEIPIKQLKARMLTYLGTKLKQWHFEVPASTINLLLNSALQVLNSRITRQGRDFPQDIMVFPNTGSMEQLEKELWSQVYDMIYSAWLHYPDNYQYLLDFSYRGPPRYPLYHKKYKQHVARTALPLSVFRTDDYRGLGVHYVYKDRLYTMGTNNSGELAVSLTDIKYLGLARAYAIQTHRASYQLTDHIWYIPADDQLHTGPDVSDPVVSPSKLNKEARQLYQTLLLYVKRTYYYRSR